MKREIAVSPIQNKEISGGDVVTENQKSSRRIEAEQALVRQNKKLTKELASTIEELARTRKELHRNARLAAVGNIAGSVSHEIINPVTGVMGYLAFVRKRNQDESLTVYLDKAISEVERISRIAKSLLVFSRRSQPPLLAPFDIGPSILNLQTLVGTTLHEADVTLTVTIPHGLPLVTGRVDEFQQCLLNLLLNARDAVKDCPVRNVMVQVKKQKNILLIVVTDTGPGVSVAAQKHLFQPFYTSKPAGQGSGLGLTVTRELMQHMGGSAAFDAGYSGGAKFVLTLPIFAGEPVPIAIP